ncbi:MAG: hypothetical protein AB1757_27090 [Acidobacteriota bacterium]
MATTDQPVYEIHQRMWECKECHSMIDASETIAYHLINGVLYGWCPICFTTSLKQAA